MTENQEQHTGILLRPKTGTTLAVTAGLSFFVLCMILPLVGPAGSRVEHAGKNQAAFIMVLLLTLTLSALSTYSKFGRRKIDGSPLPVFSVGLSTVCVLTLIVLLFGGFAI